MAELPNRVSHLEWWYQDIEDLVKELWGQKWEGGAAMGFPGQNTYHDVEVDFGVQEGDDYNQWIEGHTFEEAKAAIDRFKAEGMPREEYASPGVDLLLNWLSYEGHIERGSYRVTVYW